MLALLPRPMELLSGVEDAFILAAKRGANPQKIERLRNQWKNLVSITLRAGDSLIDKLGEMTATDPVEAAELQFQATRLEALSETAKLLSKMKKPSPVLNDSKIEEKRRELRKIVSDRLDAAVEGVPPAVKGDAFKLVSTPDILNSHRKTLSERWLNDVLKWQAIDLNLQRRNGVDKAELLRLKKDKQVVILSQLEARIAHESQATAIEEEADAMLAAVEDKSRPRLKN